MRLRFVRHSGGGFGHSDGIRPPDMCVNGNLTRTDLAVLGAVSLLILALNVYWGRIAWRSSPSEYVAYLQRWRPRSWRRWPVYGPLWRLSDSVPRLTLWQARIGLVIGTLMGLCGLVAAATIALRERWGIPAC